MRHVHTVYPLFGDSRCATCHALVPAASRQRPATPAERDVDLGLLGLIAAQAAYRFGPLPA